MESWVPLIVAFIGVVFGSYFAFSRTKHEKLWSDRYNRICSALEKANLLHRYFTARSNGEAQMTGLTAYEYEQLHSSWPAARHDLGHDITMIRMLFSARRVSSAVEAWDDLEKEVFVLLELTPGFEYDTQFQTLSNAAMQLEEALILLARKGCLKPW